MKAVGLPPYLKKGRPKGKILEEMRRVRRKIAPLVAELRPLEKKYLPLRGKFIRYSKELRLLRWETGRAKFFSCPARIVTQKNEGTMKGYWVYGCQLENQEPNCWLTNTRKGLCFRCHLTQGEKAVTLLVKKLEKKPKGR